MFVPAPTHLRKRALVSSLVEGFRWTAFWTAIVLPFLHVPLLYTGNEYVEVLVGLVLLNVVCLVAGFRYRVPQDQ